MSNIRNFNEFNNIGSASSEDVSKNEDGILLSDTLETFREKTNGIIEKVNILASAPADVPLSGIVQASAKKLIGNVTGSTADLAEISIITESDKIVSNDNDTTIPTSAAIHDFQEKRYVSARISSAGVATNLHGISVARQSTGVYNVTILDSHQLPAGERYNLVGQLQRDLPGQGATQSRINDSWQIQSFQLADVNGDPVYRFEIFEIESFEGHGGGNDGNSASFVSVNRRDSDFVFIGLPASDQ